MLRAIRQAIELEFTIERKTFRAIKKKASKILDDVVPYEMVTEEFFKAFEIDPSKTMELFREVDLQKTLFPELEACKEVKQPKNYHPEIYLEKHIDILLSKLKPEDSLRLKLAALFHDIGKVETQELQTVKGVKQMTYYNHAEVGAEQFKKIAKRMRFPGRLTSDIAFLIKYHLFLWHGDFKEMRVTTLSKIFLKNPELGQDLIRLHEIDVSRRGKAGREDLDYLKRAKKYIEKIEKETFDKRQKRVVLPLDGDDIMQEFSLEEGKKIGRALDFAKEKYIESAMEKRKMTKLELISFLDENRQDWEEESEEKK
jgi:putative nucleotidyltransferase with HDIG domain